jgi:GTP cyclohydrolase I
MEQKINKELLQEAACLIIEAIGEDLQDPNFTDTPSRFAKSFESLFKTKYQVDNEVHTILKTSFPSGGYEGMIFCTGIRTYSFCPHHLLPITYDSSIGYIPSKSGKVLGASKLPRIIDLFCKRATLQEELTTVICNTLQEYLEPEGIALVMKGTHDCMRIRGVMQQNSKFETSEMRGSFRTNQATRDEFFHLINVRG